LALRRGDRDREFGGKPDGVVGSDGLLIGWQVRRKIGLPVWLVYGAAAELPQDSFERGLLRCARCPTPFGFADTLRDASSEAWLSRALRDTLSLKSRFWV
jgi:hypothetical protein